MPIRRSRSLFAFVFAAACAQLGGCAVVKVANADGSEIVSVQPIVQDLPVVGSQARLVNLTAIGVSNTPMSFTVGFQEAEIVTAPADCRAIFVLRSDAEAAAAARLAKSVEEKCIIQSRH